MTENLILICVAIFLPMGLVIANRLLDRTAIRRKDDTIKTLTDKVTELVTRNQTAEAKARISDDLTDYAKAQASNSTERAEMTSEAKRVTSLDEAIALAQKQIDRSRK